MSEQVRAVLAAQSRRTVPRLLAVVLAGVALAVVVATPGHAYSAGYCTGYWYSGDTCTDGEASAHSWIYNHVLVDDGSSVAVNDTCEYLRTDAGNIRAGGGCIANSRVAHHCYADGSPMTHGQGRQYSGGYTLHMTAWVRTDYCDFAN
jgi:hypothetical protein